MTSTTVVNNSNNHTKKPSHLSIGSPTSLHKHRQSQLYRDLELLLDLTPSTFSSPLLSLPKELRQQIFTLLLPSPSPQRPELHTCLWGADMIAAEPWRHSIVDYAPKVPPAARLPPPLLLINKTLRAELLALYWARCKLTLHAELRNTRFQNDRFDYSPHILRLPLLPSVTHVRFYVEWNYTVTKAAARATRLADYVRMTEDFGKAMDEVLGPMGRVEGIELSVLFFWKYRSGKVYALTMADLFDVEDVLKTCVEGRWLGVLKRGEESAAGVAAGGAVQEGAAVGYKLSSEKKGLEQSGGMEIFVSADLEGCMGRKRKEVDFYGHFAVNETLPQPGYEAGNMI